MRSPTTSKVWGPATVLLAAASLGCHPPPPALADDPPEVVVGERLFLETRFAQLFAASVDVSGDVNQPLAAGDPVLDALETTGAPQPGPFAGKSMNCRACHLVDEGPDPGTTGIRTYADFARRSPIPDRGDGRTHTPRNSPPLVNASLAPSPTWRASSARTTGATRWRRAAGACRTPRC